MIHDLVDLCKNKFAREARQRIQKKVKVSLPIFEFKTNCKSI